MRKRIKRPKQKMDINLLSEKELKELIMTIAKKLNIKLNDKEI